MRNPFRYFNSSPEVIRLAVMMYIRYPLSLRQVEDILFERGIDICHETVRYWWNRFGPMFAAAIRKRRLHHRSFSQWRWHLDEVFFRINGETHYLWRAVDHEGEVLEVFATKRRDRRAALNFLKRTMKRHGRPRSIVTDRLRTCLLYTSPSPRDSAVLVEPFRSDVCGGDQKTTHSSSIVFAMALAPRRGIRHDQWRDALSLACRRSRRRGPRSFCHKTPGSHGCVEVFEACNETLWPTAVNCNRSASVVPIGDESNRQCCRSGVWSVAEQPG